MIQAHLPALQVVVPLFAAPLCLLLPWPRAAWLLATVVSWLAAGIALALLWTVRAEGPISYALGSWPPPIGIEYRVDLLNAFILVIVAGIGAVVMPFAKASVERELPPERIVLFYVMYLLCLTGLLGITITGDAFNLFVFLEISSLSSYVLISLGRDRRALTAAFRYLIMGTIGATFYVIGIGLLYMLTGTLNIADLAARLPPLLTLPAVQAALAFLLVGISLKLALFPLHLWLPNAYAYAPTVVTVFLAATATKVSVYVLIRILYTLFGGLDLPELPLRPALMGLGMLAMIAASLVAIFETNVKRMLAYSSLAQIGYMVLGLGLGTAAGLAAGIVHIFNHALTKATLFMAVGCASQRQVIGLRDLAGLGRRMPLVAAAILVGALSLVGVPVTVGFVTKWALIQAALAVDLWPVALVVLASGLLALIYGWRLVEAAYFQPLPDEPAAVAPPLAMQAPLLLLTVACLLFGLAAGWTLGLAEDAAAALVGPAP